MSLQTLKSLRHVPCSFMLYKNNEILHVVIMCQAAVEERLDRNGANLVLILRGLVLRSTHMTKPKGLSD